MSETTGQKRTKKRERSFFEEMFYMHDGGPDTHVYINGKPCVYWTEGMWISKSGIELDERPE